MKRSTCRSISIALSIVLLCNSTAVLAAGGGKGSYVAPSQAARVSDRLIVKFKPNDLPKGLSVAQITSQLSQPLSVQTVSQMQVAAGVSMTELHAIPNGAHVLSVAGQPNRQTLDKAIAGIRNLPNVEYVEEDRILTAQAAVDPYITTGPTGNPGLWGMLPVTAVTSPAPGGTGSYGADFQTAWSTATGTGVVVAVVDTGITPHVDIVGPGGTVSPATGNLVSSGYDFISDCRTRGTCPATQTSGTATTPVADATDKGDFITLAECTNVNSIFYDPACTTPSNSSWHGTHVAGTIAALGNNGVGVIGGAYSAKILPVRVLGKGGGHLSDIANGIRWAAGLPVTGAITNTTNPAKVINMSLGGTGACSITEQDAINAAVAAGAVVVVAAGNDHADVANSDPANCQNVISVAAIARDGSRAVYSNFSSPASNITNPVNVTLAAQGGDQSYSPTYDPGILSTLDSGTTTPMGSTYGYYQGTSMATPHVAAAAALMIAHNSALTPAQIKTILAAPSSLTAFPSFSAPSFASYDCATKGNCGAGILNAKLAVQNSSPAALTAANTTDFGAASVNTAVSRTITFTNGSGVPITLGAATISGNNAALFSVVTATDTCSGQTIAAGNTCQVTVSYVPAAAGVHSATLTVPDTTTATKTFVALTGSAGSQLATSTPTVTAATLIIGHSTTVNLSFTNPNWIALPVGAIALSNTAIMATSIDNCSNTTLAAGASCTATVTVTPATTGSYTGTATLGLSGGGTPAVATISGSANAPAPASGGGGGGGCSIMPAGANPDVSLLFALLAVGVYWLRRRIVHDRGAA